MNDAALKTLGQHLVVEESVRRTVSWRERVDLLIGGATNASKASPARISLAGTAEKLSVAIKFTESIVAQ